MGPETKGISRRLGRCSMMGSVSFEEAAILESHGIEVQSPGGQSNSDEVDGNDFPDQVGSKFRAAAAALEAAGRITVCCCCVTGLRGVFVRQEGRGPAVWLQPT